MKTQYNNGNYIDIISEEKSDDLSSKHRGGDQEISSIVRHNAADGGNNTAESMISGIMESR